MHLHLRWLIDTEEDDERLLCGRRGGRSANSAQGPMLCLKKNVFAEKFTFLTLNEQTYAKI
jgi:hypothetical protein